MGNSLGCSPSGERLVSAARDGDLQEAQALIDFNPRLAKYSTFGVRNSPIHFAASQGHNEIVMLLLDNGVDVNIRNYCGQTALMQACRFGHWEVVQTLILYRANVSRADYLNARTALHFAAINGHARCIRLVFADLIPSLPFNGPLDSMCGDDGSSVKARIDLNAVSRIVNKPADGGITALHIAALNGHVDCVQLLLDLTASVTAITVQDGTTIDLIGAGSTPLHYAACGGSAACCQALISRGAIRATTNSTGWTAMQVARHWGRHWLEPLLTPDSQAPIPSFPPSRYLSMPLMSIVKIARECGWRSQETCPAVADCCAVCLERRCTVAAEGCGHELCTRCALYLCSTSNAVTAVLGPPGTIPCPLCRNPIVSFLKLPATPIVREVGRPGMSLAMCTPCSTQVADPITTCCPMSRPDYRGNKLSPITLNNFRTMSCRAFCVTTPHFDACGGDDSEDEHANDVGNRRASGRPGQHSDHAVWPSRRRTSEAPLRRSASVSSRPHLETRCWFNSLLFKDVY